MCFDVDHISYPSHIGGLGIVNYRSNDLALLHAVHRHEPDILLALQPYMSRCTQLIQHARKYNAYLGGFYYIHKPTRFETICWSCPV